MLRFKLGEIVGGKVLPDPSPTDPLTPPSFWEMPFAEDLIRKVASFSISQYPCLPHEIGFAAEEASLSCCSTRYMALVSGWYRVSLRYLLTGKRVQPIPQVLLRPKEISVSLIGFKPNLDLEELSRRISR